MTINPITDLQPGKELVIEGFIVVSEHGWLHFTTIESPGYLTIMPHTLKATIPEDFNPVVKAVDAVDQQLGALADKYHQEAAKLRDKRAQLLNLGYNAGMVVGDTQ